MLGAQSAEPSRPALGPGADPNDWESYYDYGVSILPERPHQADSAFAWANRLDPTRAEPLYARWIAFWMTHTGEWAAYLKSDPRVLSRREIVAADSFRVRAWERNPMVNQALVMLPMETLPGSRGRDAYSRGWIAYADGAYTDALALFTAAIASDPKRYSLRYPLALVYTQTGQYDSAAAQLERLRNATRRADTTRLVYVRQSNEMIEYALGRLYAAAGRPADAQRAQERALEENLGFAPAHAALGKLAAARGDTGSAARELALAVELSPADGVLRYWYGIALLTAQRPAEAAVQFRETVRLEPWFADGYLALAGAYDARQDIARAKAANAEFLERAPRRRRPAPIDAPHSPPPPSER